MKLYRQVFGIWDNTQHAAYCPDCYHPMEQKRIVWGNVEVWHCDHCTNVFYHEQEPTDDPAS